MGHELTKNDIKKMEEEIEYRIHEVRKAALDDVKETRAQGDLSENFEYHAAKRFKNKNESRIRYLQRTIKNATVIDDSSADDEVGVNNTVEVLYEDDESTETIKIVTTIRADSLSGMISIESPLGKALLFQADMIQKQTGRFVCRILRHKFTLYRNLKNGLLELIREFRIILFQSNFFFPVNLNQGQQVQKLSYDPLLFVSRWDRDE